MRWTRLALVIHANIAAASAMMEIALRSMPGLIPVGSLYHFEPNLRAEIAGRRDMMTKLDAVYVERDDDGPPHRCIPSRRAAWRAFIRRRVHGSTRWASANPLETAYRAESFDVISLGDSFLRIEEEPAFRRDERVWRK